MIKRLLLLRARNHRHLPSHALAQGLGLGEVPLLREDGVTRRLRAADGVEVDLLRGHVHRLELGRLPVHQIAALGVLGPAT